MRARAGQVGCQWSLKSVECMLRMNRTPLAVPSRGSMAQSFDTWTLEPACLGQPYRARPTAPAPLGRKKAAGALSPGCTWGAFPQPLPACMPGITWLLCQGGVWVSSLQRSPLQGTECTRAEGSQLLAAIVVSRAQAGGQLPSRAKSQFLTSGCLAGMRVRPDS